MATVVHFSAMVSKQPRKRLVCVLKPSADRVGLRTAIQQIICTLFPKRKQHAAWNHTDTVVPDALTRFHVSESIWKDTHKLVADSLRSRRRRQFILEELCRVLNQKHYLSLGLQVQPYDASSFRERPRADVTGILFYAIKSC